KVVPTISWLLLKGFFWRMKEKYVIRDFHPLVFFYALGMMLSLIGLGLGIAIIVLRAMGNGITPATVVLIALLLISGSQFTLFAMWFDMESNKDLGGRGRRGTDGCTRAEALPDEDRRPGQGRRGGEQEEEEAGREGRVGVDAELAQEADEEGLPQGEAVDR